MPTEIALVVEDDLSLAMLERIVEASECRFKVTRTLVERGFGNIKRSIAKYRSASHVIPHIVLTDLDRIECAATLRRTWGAEELPSTMLFRVAVREVEAWLLADRASFANFANISVKKVPLDPDQLEDPKQVLINLVRNSRSRRLAMELVPAPGSRVPIGPLYNERLSKFARENWRPLNAAQCSPSLNRTLNRVAQFRI